MTAQGGSSISSLISLPLLRCSTRSVLVGFSWTVRLRALLHAVAPISHKDGGSARPLNLTLAYCGRHVIAEVPTVYE